MKNEYFINAQKEEVMRGMMRKAIRALEDVGITPVLLKGFGLARLYPQSFMRAWGDIDLYVGEEAYHPGAQALREAFPEAALFEEEKDYYKHYNLTFYKPFNTAIEMHRVSMAFMHPRDARIYKKLEQQGLVQERYHYVNGEDEWWEPEWKFNVLYVFCHSWEHWLSNSAVARQFEDLALLLTKGKPEDVSYKQLEAYLKTNLRKLHLLEAWKRYAYIVVSRFNVPANDCPCYDARVADRAEALWLSVQQGRQRVAPNKAPKNVILRKWSTFRQRVREAKIIAQYEPVYARHMVWENIAQSFVRFLHGENTRKWE